MVFAELGSALPKTITSWRKRKRRRTKRGSGAAGFRVGFVEDYI
jgi:hypothetical protein